MPSTHCGGPGWLDSLTTLAERVNAARSLVAVSDREGDVYRKFVHRPAAVDLVVRTGQDRKLADGGRLFTATRDWPELGRMAVEVPAHRPAEGARTASLAVRARPVTLKRPGRASAAEPAQVAMTLVELAVLGLVAAARTLQLVDARAGSDRPASDVLDTAFLAAVAAIGRRYEGATARQQNPYPEGSLAWLSWIIARLGGWKCYYKPPGPTTMRQGWDRLADHLHSYPMANP